MKKPFFAVTLVSLIVAFGSGSSLSAQGTPSKPVTQSQISKLQKQITTISQELEEAQDTISFLQEQMRNSKLNGLVFSRHVWLTPAGLSTGCGDGAVNVSTFTIPGSTAGLTGCVADILVRPLPNP